MRQFHHHLADRRTPLAGGRWREPIRSFQKALSLILDWNLGTYMPILQDSADSGRAAPLEHGAD